MGRNSFGIDGKGSVLFCYFIFLKLCLGKSSLKLLFQPCFCRNHGGAVVAHCIGNKSAVHRNDLCILGVCHHGHMPFFAVDTWEIGIRSKAAGQLFCYFIIMLHAFGASLLVAAHNQADTLVQLHTGITEKLHCIEGFDHRSFVICGSSAVYVVPFACQHKWVISPVTAYRNNIQVSCDADDFLSLAHLCITAVIVQVHSLKAKLLCDLKSHLKCFGRAFPKWHSLFCRSKLGINCNQLSKIGKHFF